MNKINTFLAEEKPESSERKTAGEEGEEEGPVRRGKESRICLYLSWSQTLGNIIPAFGDDREKKGSEKI